MITATQYKFFNSPKHVSALCRSHANNPTNANTLESTIHLCRVKSWVLVKIHYCTVSHTCRNSTADCVNKDTHLWWWQHHIKKKKKQGLDWTKKGQWNVKPTHHAQIKMNQNNWKERFIPIPLVGVLFQASWLIKHSSHHPVMPPTFLRPRNVTVLSTLHKSSITALGQIYQSRYKGPKVTSKWHSLIETNSDCL